MELKDCNVIYATKEHILGMLHLNYKIYPKEWHVSPQYVSSIMDKNDKVYRIILVDNEVKGIYSMFPLPKDIYNGVLKGQIEEKDLDKYILPYTSSNEVYLYFISMIVDTFDSNRKLYAKSLVKDIPNQLSNIEELGIKIKELGAIAISEEGEKIAPKIGFNFTNEYITYKNKKFPVFRGEKTDFLKAIK